MSKCSRLEVTGVCQKGNVIFWTFITHLFLNTLFKLLGIVFKYRWGDAEIIFAMNLLKTNIPNREHPHVSWYARGLPVRRPACIYEYMSAFGCLSVCSDAAANIIRPPCVIANKEKTISFISLRLGKYRKCLKQSYVIPWIVNLTGREPYMFNKIFVLVIFIPITR